MNSPAALRFYDRPICQSTTLIVGWNEDASKLGIRAADYLIQGLGCREFGEILPESFFPMAGVSVEEDVAMFPESKFYINNACSMIVFKSNIPRMEWHKFLSALLDAAQECEVKEIYTLGAMVAASAHTMPRALISIMNSADMQSKLEPFNIIGNTDYETPPGQKPTLSSYLLWLARQRGIPAVNLWVPVPYYLVPVDDPRGCKRIVYFFNSKFDLGIDFTRIDADITEQNSRISNLFEKSPDIEGLVRRLEVGEGLDGAESEKLAREVLEHLKK